MLVGTGAVEVSAVVLVGARPEGVGSGVAVTVVVVVVVVEVTATADTVVDGVGANVWADVTSGCPVRIVDRAGAGAMVDDGPRLSGAEVVRSGSAPPDVTWALVSGTEDGELLGAGVLPPRTVSRSDGEDV